MQEMNGATDQSVAELKERIQVLEKELDNANELLSSSKLRGLLQKKSKISQHRAMQGLS